MMEALVPPKPNEFERTVSNRGWPRLVGHNVEIERRHPVAKVDIRREKLIRSARRLMTASIAPAAPSEWPIIPLVELTGTRAEQLGNRLAFRGVVERRRRAVRVDVIDRLGGQVGALAARRSIACRADRCRRDPAG